MKIALLTDGIWPFVMGGMQVHSYLLSKYLTRQSVFVTVFHPAIKEKERQQLQELYAPEERHFLEWVEVPQVARYRFPGHYLFESFLFSKNIFQVLSVKKDFDFVYAKGFAGWYLLTRKKDLNVPVAVNIHGYEFMQRKACLKEWWIGKLLALPFRYINQKADYVFSYGGKISQYIRQLKVPGDRILELPGAVEKTWLWQETVQKNFDSIRKFVFVGRFERRKGIPELNRVIKDLMDSYAFEFHFVGPIPDHIQLKNNHIVYHGQTSSRSELIAILDQCDVLVCPSYSEGMPNVILEAMARGCPIIATDVGAVSLMVNSSTGWLIAPASYGSLKKAMEIAITADISELQRKSSAALQLIRDNYIWNEVGKRTAQILEQCTKNKNTREPELVIH